MVRMGLPERERRRGVQSSHWEETVRGRRCPPTDRWERPIAHAPWVGH